ncbi:hypothetical protein TNIN_53161 [Trichonephila inaurata madagascariensis]|uniref:Uncharacterized protein n=1 Tax=Trichonephila inaurata madagascariensis TaxID=2747483 RepID=A0A8X7CE84_9ARAC|nr:hypothetical protein TNIN_53161 [Trichonephila inaurata madagascariensis]
MQKEAFTHNMRETADNILERNIVRGMFAISRLINSFKSGKSFGLQLYILYLRYQQNQKPIGVSSGDYRGHINGKYLRWRGHQNGVPRHCEETFLFAEVRHLATKRCH